MDKKKKNSVKKKNTNTNYTQNKVKKYNKIVNNLTNENEFVPIKKKTSSTNKKSNNSTRKNIRNNTNQMKKEQQKMLNAKNNRLFIKNKNIWYIIIGIIILILFIFSFVKIKNIWQTKKISREREITVLNIKEHYSKYVKTKNNAILYRLDNNEYYEYGLVYKDVELTLTDIEINYLTEYFYSEDLDAYIKYNDLMPIDNLTTYDNRYQNYIVFNKSIVTNDNFTFYDNDKEIYSFNESMTLPIIINNYENNYYVEFNNRLLMIKKDDVKEIINQNNTTIKNASKITTLCYHRVYDMDEKCNDLYICKKKANFDKEMKYLKDNNFLTLTMQEMLWYLKGNIQIPKKSVVITLDDGHLIKSAIDVLEKYELYATSFIKTKSFDDLSGFESDYLELQSHTHNMHTPGACPIERAYQQGGAILCKDENYVLNDLKTSREKLNGAIALAYPFYDFNERAVKLVKEAGFSLAFIGANGVKGRSWPGINVYKIPRMTMWDTTSYETFKGYVNN